MSPKEFFELQIVILRTAQIIKGMPIIEFLNAIPVAEESIEQIQNEAAKTKARAILRRAEFSANILLGAHESLTIRDAFEQ